jgi:hypothetical protein
MAQRGPDESVLKSRYFKRKDAVENYLAAKLMSGAMPLEEARRGIAADWTSTSGLQRATEASD